MITPKYVKEFDTMELCRLLDISKERLIKKIKRAKRDSYLWRQPRLFEKQIDKATFAYLEEKLYQFPGFHVEPRALRNYPYKVAAHTLGYVGEVNSSILEKNPYYRSGDYIGITGLEKTYEKELRGKKGRKIILVDKYNKEVGSYKDGKYDTTAIRGQDIHSSLDVELQAYGELLMQNKKGSIVAIEPQTGEILTLVTSPTYDPNLLVGRIRGRNYGRLSKDTLVPLFNRALMAQYPPGSTFKLVNALIGIEEGVLNEWTRYSCDGPESLPIKCSHYHVSPLDVVESIEQSCNPFYWMNFKKILENRKYGSTAEGFEAWRGHVLSMGFDKKIKSDLSRGAKGNIPKKSYYDRYYGENRWRALTVRSLSIGQGEILVTPLQLTNLACILANRGFYYEPHLVRAIGDKKPESDRRNKIETSISPENFDLVIEGMYQVFEGDHGTARFNRVDSISMCGKTGTVQNPHGEDHSIFIAFAPKDDPKIAISVIVENSGFGSTWAVPITTLMIEKYLNREVSRKVVEERMINGNLIQGN
jgi:penicillin-binding protein 2